MITVLFHWLRVSSEFFRVQDFPHLKLRIRDFPYMKLGIRDFSYMKLGIRDFPHWKLGIRDFKAKSGRVSRLDLRCDAISPSGLRDCTKFWVEITGLKNPVLEYPDFANTCNGVACTLSPLKYWGNLANIMSIHCILFGLPTTLFEYHYCSSNMHHQMSGTQEVQGGLQPKGGLVHNRVIFTPVPTRINKIHS